MLPGSTVVPFFQVDMRVFFTLNRSFYLSTSSTPSVRADSSSYIEIYKLWSHNCDRDTYSSPTSQCCKREYQVDHATPCHAIVLDTTGTT